jgi:hypothetical protein
MSGKKASLVEQLCSIEDELDSCKKKCDKLENRLEKKETMISKLKANISVERLKVTLLSAILKTSTGLDFDQICQCTEEGVKLVNYKGGQIPVLVQEYHGEVDQGVKYLVVSPSKKKKEKTFRSVKSSVVTVKPEIEDQKIREVYDKIEEIKGEKGLNMSQKNIIVATEELFAELTSAGRGYKKILSSMKELRNKLLARMDLKDYTDLVHAHVKRLEVIFKQKKFEPKKIGDNVKMGLSPIDMRLTYYKRYYEVEIETEDIETFKICMAVNMKYSTRYVPFSQTDVVTKLSNYSMCLYPLKENLNRVLVNPCALNNIVYLVPSKGCDGDPYSFYVLAKAEGGKRHWNLELRLDILSSSIAEPLKTFTSKLFRKIYADIFGDNTYRSDYREFAPIIRHDCLQLLHNLVDLCQPKLFCNMMRDIVSEKCVLSPEKDVDKFDFTADNKEERRMFLSEKDNIDTIYKELKRLFDDIRQEQIEEFYSTISDK